MLVCVTGIGANVAVSHRYSGSMVRTPIRLIARHEGHDLDRFWLPADQERLPCPEKDRAQRPDIALAEGECLQNAEVSANDDQHRARDRKDDSPPLPPADPLAQDHQAEQQHQNRQDGLDQRDLQRGRFLQRDIKHGIEPRDRNHRKQDHELPVSEYLCPLSPCSAPEKGGENDESRRPTPEIERQRRYFFGRCRAADDGIPRPDKHRKHQEQIA